MDNRSFHEALQQYLVKLEEESLAGEDYARILCQVFNHLIGFLTDHSFVQFTTLFARISYISSTYRLTGKETYILHICRLLPNDWSKYDKFEIFEIPRQALNILVRKGLGEEPFYPERLSELYEKIHKASEEEYDSFIVSKLVIIHEIDASAKRIHGQEQTEPFKHVVIRYDQPDYNEDYSPIMSAMSTSGALPVLCNLLNVKADKDGTLFPSSFIFEPDFLFDVTSVSECFGAFATHELGYILRRFIDKPSSRPLLVGNLANYFLDQLMFHPTKTFNDLIQNIFHLYPLSFTRFSNEEIRELIEQLKVHYASIKKTVTTDLPKMGLTRKTCYIEPSFYSAKYGIQGRLDLFSLTSETATIVELKSGSPFRPNGYGLSNNHYHQTLLYDLLIESVFPKHVKRNNFLLYSKEASNNIRYAPGLKSEQREALKIRNILFLHDLKMGHSQTDILDYVSEYAQKNPKAVSGFIATDLRLFQETLSGLNPNERAYFNYTVQFILKEQKLAKLGDDNSDRMNGLASLWRDNIRSKVERFNILNHLEIIRNQSMSDDPVIDLEKSPLTAPLSNFRKGDIAVFYPDLNKPASILSEQVFKCTIIDFTSSFIKIRLRSKQENNEVFKKFTYWHLEHDVLENGFYSMTRSLFTFMQSPGSFRSMVMGEIPPRLYEVRALPRPPVLTEEQYELYQRIICAKDYFLLWGPPGTGKTSVLFKELVAYFVNQTDEKLLLMAYTNRAVDEMCKAILDIDSEIDFIRIGSRYSTREDYKGYLIREKIKDLKTRKDLKTYLNSVQIYIGTVASLMGRSDLFELVSFDRAIVDEASQILEPSLIGLLSRIKRFTLIGDHLQLPAVVMQGHSYSLNDHPGLKTLGFTNLSNSLFERMFLRACDMNWEHAYGLLSFQGRMHEDIMALPNHLFYGNLLKILPKSKRLKEPRNLVPLSKKDGLWMNERIVFLPVRADKTAASIKINEMEALTVVTLLRNLTEAYSLKGKEIREDSIGIITPFRAQIAQIMRLIRTANVDPLGKITVDTVERYQGSARDIVIFSTAINAAFQLKSLVSLSENGVDRKLNVALTRAREQFILVGDPDLLGTNPAYRYLMDEAYSMSFDLAPAIVKETPPSSP